MLRLREESAYRARAYETASEVVEAYAGDLEKLDEEGRLTDLPGIGRSLAATIGDLLRSGRSHALEEVMGDMPPGLLPLVGIPGFTRRRISLLHSELGAEDVDAVRSALTSGAAEQQIRGVTGDVAERLLASLDASTVEPRGTVLAEALRLADRLVAHLRRSAPDARVALAGDCRRGVELVHRLDFVVAFDDPARIASTFSRQPGVVQVSEQGANRWTVRLVDGLAATLDVVRRTQFGTALLLATGSAAHLDRLRRRARSPGIDLEATESASEDDVYRALGLPFIPPELREGRDEVDLAERGDEFRDLITFADLRGAVHCHTLYSDGKNSIPEMASAAAALGLSYLTVTDHSPAASYAGGLSEERLAQQRAEIERLRSSAPLDLLAGAECDILRDGRLDHSDEARRALEVVIASVHVRYKMDREAMTDRIVRALEGPRFTIWGHPLGRLLLRRRPIDCDIDRVLDVAARAAVGVEINGSPWRLDLPSELIPGARRRGLRFVIAADAHSTGELEYLRHGVTVARRGGLRRHEVLNALPAAEFRRLVAGAAR